MTVRVIIPPDPIVEPSDIAGSHSASDATVAAMIRMSVCESGMHETL